MVERAQCTSTSENMQTESTEDRKHLDQFGNTCTVKLPQQSYIYVMRKDGWFKGILKCDGLTGQPCLTTYQINI